MILIILFTFIIPNFKFATWFAVVILFILNYQLLQFVIEIIEINFVIIHLLMKLNPLHNMKVFNKFHLFYQNSKATTAMALNLTIINFITSYYHLILSTTITNVYLSFFLILNQIEILMMFQTIGKVWLMNDLINSFILQCLSHFLVIYIFIYKSLSRFQWLTNMIQLVLIITKIT